MCSFTATNRRIDLARDNRHSQKRGPDRTDIVTVEGVQFLHNLLHITGERIPQPFVSGDVACVFNGEIYNFREFGEFRSDGECIIPLYREYGLDFARRLDGEFAICLVDFRNSLLILINDTFACKPLWFGKKGGDWGAASYKSSLRRCGFDSIEKMQGNGAYCFDLRSLELLNRIRLRDFDLSQHKATYDDWIASFERSIQKRTANTDCRIFLGLSAGYDSGAIALALTTQDIDFKAFTILSGEDREIIRRRHERLRNGEVIELTAREYRRLTREVNASCEDFEYQDAYRNYDIKKDKASIGLAAICSRASRDGYRIYLSGQGADEILSDYGHNGVKFYNHSSFGGKFPDDLNGFFPWHSFYDGTQIQYLNKEEYVAGAYGIETRYPFLDNDLVQEFLWLSSDLKNALYKAPLSHYLSSNGYPFQAGVKTGFQANKNLVSGPSWFSFSGQRVKS